MDFPSQPFASAEPAPAQLRRVQRVPQMTYTIPPNSAPVQRLECLLSNYLYTDFLLHVETHGEFFSSDASQNTHWAHTLERDHPRHAFLLSGAGLDTFPGLHHIDITIQTRVASTGVENLGRDWYVHSLEGKCCDKDGHMVLIEGHGGRPVEFHKRFQCGPTQPWGNGSIAAQMRELYTWECVVEYLKYGVLLIHTRGGSRESDPLASLGLLGEGPTLRRRSAVDGWTHIPGCVPQVIGPFYS